ncbi:hypothetical protein M0802_009199 [Mischocyttarus mexicanus]|nr:hypothetical protein M0802_009199 [Mischocyttarus mexicanus]
MGFPNPGKRVIANDGVSETGRRRCSLMARKENPAAAAAAAVTAATAAGAIRESAGLNPLQVDRYKSVDWWCCCCRIRGIRE